VSQATAFPTRLRWLADLTLIRQSRALPSLCSEVVPTPHPREIPDDEPPQLAMSSLSTAVVPGLAFGVQLDCGM